MRAPPIFIVHVTMQGCSGSGIQVDASHVLTCAHVLHPLGPEEFYAEPEGKRPDVRHYPVRVRFGRFETAGTVIAQHKLLDLVVIKLARPRPGIAAPLEFDSGYGGGACVVGLTHVGQRPEALLQPIGIVAKASSQGPLLKQVKHEFGAQEGTSGGGVFADRDGSLLCVGVATLGGERAKMGAYIPAESMVGFLKEAIGFELRPPPTNDHGRYLARSGVAANWEFKTPDGQLALAFAPILQAVPDAPASISFVSRRVVTASQMRLLMRDRILPGHHRLPAWAKTAEQADSAIGQLGEAMKWKFRLPMPEELQIAWRGTNFPAGQLKAPEARPLALRDFKANDWGIEIPPMGAIEWAREANGYSCAVERSSVEDGPGPTTVPPGDVSLREPCFRAAFDVEGL